MMYKKIVTALLIITLPAYMQATFKLLDQGIKVISGPVENTMITYSDAYQKLNLDGRAIPLDHQIKVEIVRQEVIADKMVVDLDDITNKYITNAQKNYGMTQQDFVDLAGQCYRTFPELKDQLSRNYMYDFFLHNKFRAHLVPTEQDIQKYCDEHPQVEPGYFIVKTAELFFGTNKQAVKEQVKNIIAGTQSDQEVSWSEPITVQVDELDEEMAFIKDLADNEIFVVENNYSLQLYQLIEKKADYIVPLEKRKAVIIDILNRAMYQDLLANYEQHMFDNIAIITLAS